MPTKAEQRIRLKDTSSKHLKITVKSNCLVFHKQFISKKKEPLPIAIAVHQAFFEVFDKYVSDKSKTLKNIKQFVKGVLYGSKVSVMNCTNTEHELQLITEIPKGAVPVKLLKQSYSTDIKISPLSTNFIEFYFYFPEEGEFTIYPASINKGNHFISKAEVIQSFKVVGKKSSENFDTFTDLLNFGSKEDLLNYLETKDLENDPSFSFKKLYWMMGNKEFYQNTIKILNHRMCYDSEIWAYSMLHNDLDNFKVFLCSCNIQSKFKNINIQFFKNSLLEIDNFRVKEYSPLINPRIHSISKGKLGILNTEFKSTYSKFIEYLMDKGTLESKDYLLFSIYLLLQQRIQESLEIYKKINKQDFKGNQLKIQYDYLSAYLDFYDGYPMFKKAREICKRYLTYPVISWRNKFCEMANKLSEFDGDDNLIDSKDPANQAAKQSISPYFHCELKGSDISISASNLSSYLISFYIIEPEVILSENPFVNLRKKDYSYLKPKQMISKKFLKTVSQSFTETVPSSLLNSNMLINCRSGNKIVNLTFFPSKMKVFVNEQIGRVKVTQSNGKPLPKVYIKCFALRNNFGQQFYKDGYTDLLGTFDYATLNLDSLKLVNKFLLLIVSKEFGTIVKNVTPPNNTDFDCGKEVVLKSLKWNNTQRNQMKKKGSLFG